jgi:hypothetical protein
MTRSRCSSYQANLTKEQRSNMKAIRPDAMQAGLGNKVSNINIRSAKRTIAEAYKKKSHFKPTPRSTLGLWEHLKDW